MNKLVSRLKKIIFNPTKKELIALSIGAAITLFLVIFALVKVNQPHQNEVNNKIVSKAKITVTPTKKPTPTLKTTKTPTPTIKKYATLVPTSSYVYPSSTSTSAPSSTPTSGPTNTPEPTITPTPETPTATLTPTPDITPVQN
jgi:hypothetical protein